MKAVCLLLLAAAVALPLGAVAKDAPAPATDQAIAPSPGMTMYSSAGQLQDDCQQAIATARSGYQQLALTPADNAASFLAAWDRLNAQLENVIGGIGLLTYVDSNPQVRHAGEKCLVDVTRFNSSLFQNEKLYAALQALEPDNAIDRHVRQRLLNQFDDAGVTLDADERKAVRKITTQLAALGQEFSRHMRENDQQLHFTPAMLRGLPKNYLAKHKKDRDGGITLSMSYPDYFPFMKHASDRAARERYYRAFMNRGTKRNLEILGKIVHLRAKLADLHGLDDYAELATRHNMAGDADTVLDFLDAVRDVVNEGEARDVRMLRQAKAADLRLPLNQVELKPWDKAYYLEKLKEQRYGINQNDLRRYFPSQAAVRWVLLISSRLYNLRFEPRKVQLWADDVRYYDAFDQTTGQRIGGIYLDLYPREGKYGHAAAFPILGSSTLQNRKPVAALVTNLDRRGLSQEELTTLLHEFGHTLHNLLSHTRYSLFAGTNVAIDFVEAPSQMYEQWARSAQTLGLMAQVCKDCPIVDDKLAAKLENARRLGRGLFYARQLLYASYDMALYTQNPDDIMALWEKMEGRTAFGYVPGTHFPGTFAHIAGGYAAGYYSYMWAEAIALDLRSAFGNQLMDSKTGMRFRQQVLSHGGELPAMELVTHFLGRAPNNEALFADIRSEPVAPAATPASQPGSE